MRTCVHVDIHADVCICNLTSGEGGCTALEIDMPKCVKVGVTCMSGRILYSNCAVHKSKGEVHILDKAIRLNF